MTTRELNKINKRIAEIDKIVDLCCEDRDNDVLENLEIELDYLENKLHLARKITRRKEIGLRVVRD